MRYIDLFAGVGGFHLGIERSGQNGYTCVYSNEWDRYANSVYRRHYEECDIRDIREVAADKIPDHELIVGGFPCQAFSVAGNRGGFSDTRGTLFFEIMRIAKQKRTPYLLLENVKGLLSHDKGKTFDTMLRAMDELGYDAQWQVLNSKHWVPQNRERIFIVGYLRGQPRPQVFPLGESDGGGSQSQVRQAKDISGTITIKNQSPQWQFDASTTLIDMAYRNREPRAYTTHAPAVRDYGSGGNKMPMVTRQPLKFLGRNQKNIAGDYSYAVDTMSTNGLNIAGKIRRLTPIECERLQSFPDDWTKLGADGEEISDTQRYKMMGNAVTTKVVQAIVKQWCK